MSFSSPCFVATLCCDLLMSGLRRRYVSGATRFEAPSSVCCARRLSYHVSLRYSLPQNVIISVPQAASTSMINVNNPLSPIKAFHSGHKSGDGTPLLFKATRRQWPFSKSYDTVYCTVGIKSLCLFGRYDTEICNTASP